jgi:hypothetical protein
VSDADNDTVVYQYEWFVNGASFLNGTYGNGSGISGNLTQNIEVNIANVSSVNTTKGETWIFSCRGYTDGYYSNWTNSSSVTISNDIPVMTDANITPVPAYPYNHLIGNCTATDADADTIQYYYKWFENDIEILSGTNGISSPSGAIVNVNNLTVNYTDVGDNFTFSCLPYDGTVNGTWMNSSNVTIQQSLTINSIGYVPTYPINQSDLNCTFNVSNVGGVAVNVSVTWFRSIDNGGSWANVAAYDYTWTSVTHNLLYTTASGTGSVPSAGLTNYDWWKCQIVVNDSFNYITQNTTVAAVYPLENLTIISPANNTILNQPINATFTVLDYHGGIQCNLTVNGTVTSNNSVQNGTVTTIEYTPGSNAHYDWNVTCLSTNGNPPPVQSANYHYVYDIQAPTYQNYYKSTNTFLFPQIDDTVNLSVYVIENLVDIEYGQYWINDNNS